ncbi:hypothetical protein Tco_0412853 [Tanacetum coccineum]
MEVPDAMISDAIKKKAGYTYYMAKKVESEKDKIGQKLKGPAVDDPAVQSLLDLRKGSKASILESLKQKNQAVVGEGSSAAHNKYNDSSDNDSEATLYSSSSDKTEESANETDADESDMDLSDDNPQGDNDVARYGVFMHNKSTATPNSTYRSLTVISSSLDFIQTLLDETPTNELTDFMSHPVYTDAQTTLVMHNPKGNPELASYISDENAHHLSSSSATKMSNPTTYPQPSSLQAKAKKLMKKAKKNMRKINVNKAVAQKFREYNQKLEALTNFNVSKAFEKAVQARLYDTLYEFICLDHDALNAQDAEPSFHKRSHDNHNNREGGNKKKCRKDVGEPSSRSSRRNKSLVIYAQADTPVMKPLDQEDKYVRKHPYQEWFSKKSGLAKRKMTWFDLLLKSDIDQNENHILRPSTVAIAKKLKAIIQKDELKIADLEGAGLERLKQQYQNDVKLEYHVSQLKAAVLIESKWNIDEDDVSKPRTFERHMSKNTKPHPSFYYLVCLSTKEKYTTSITKHYAARYCKQGIEDMIPDRWCKETHRYIFEALNGIHHWDGDITDFSKAEMSTRTEGSVYSDLRIKSVVCVVVKKKWGYGFLTSIVVRRSDDK